MTFNKEGTFQLQAANSEWPKKQNKCSQTHESLIFIDINHNNPINSVP